MWSWLNGVAQPSDDPRCTNRQQWYSIDAHIQDRAMSRSSDFFYIQSCPRKLFGSMWLFHNWNAKKIRLKLLTLHWLSPLRYTNSHWVGNYVSYHSYRHFGSQYIISKYYNFNGKESRPLCFTASTIHIISLTRIVAPLHLVACIRYCWAYSSIN